MRREIRTDRAPAPIGPYSQAVLLEGDGLLFTAGQIALDPTTGELAGNVEEQTVRVMENLKAVIEEAGGTMEGIVKTTIYLKNVDDFPRVNAVYERYFGKPPFPARSTVEVSALPRGALVEIEAVVKIS